MFWQIFFVKFDMFDTWSKLILSYFALVYIKYTFEFQCMVIIIKYINMTANVYDQAHTRKSALSLPQNSMILN